MNKLHIAVIATIAFVISGCASVPDGSAAEKYSVVAKNGDQTQFRRDQAQCKTETGQRHKAKDMQQDANFVDCLVNEYGHRLVKKD